jgi:hypothetical protein
VSGVDACNPATNEVEGRGSWFEASLGKVKAKTLFEKHTKMQKKTGLWLKW